MNLPKFIIIGAMRAGTTSLYHYICQHPDVEYREEKELNYFIDYAPKSSRYRKFEWYKSKFKGFSGEASPNYMIDKEAPKRIRNVIPDVKIIAIIRDKDRRQRSQYNYCHNKGIEDKSYPQALKDEERRIKRSGFYHTYFNYQERSNYQKWLAIWRKYFPDMLEINFEDLKFDPLRVMDMIFSYLGLSYYKIIPIIYHQQSYD